MKAEGRRKKEEGSSATDSLSADVTDVTDVRKKEELSLLFPFPIFLFFLLLFFLGKRGRASGYRFPGRAWKLTFKLSPHPTFRLGAVCMEPYIETRCAARRILHLD